MSNLVSRPRRASVGGKSSPSDPINPKSLASQLDPANAEAILGFGLQAQRQMLEFYDRVLSHVRGKDTRHVREELEQLVNELKKLNVTRLREDGLLSRLPPRLPWFRRHRGTSGLFADYEEVSTRVEHLAENLEEARRRLLRDVELFDKLYDQDIKLLEALDLHITAVELKLHQLRRGPLTKLQQTADKSSDPMDQHRLEDFTSQVERLARKDRELKLARTTGIQAARQIRMFQSGIQSLIEGIQGTVLNSVPLWKNHIAIAVSRLRQHKTLQLQGEITRATSAMLEHNSGVLHRGSAEITAETQREIRFDSGEGLRAVPASSATPVGDYTESDDDADAAPEVDEIVAPATAAENVPAKEDSPEVDDPPRPRTAKRPSRRPGVHQALPDSP